MTKQEYLQNLMEQLHPHTRDSIRKLYAVNHSSLIDFKCEMAKLIAELEREIELASSADNFTRFLDFCEEKTMVLIVRDLIVKLHF